MSPTPAKIRTSERALDIEWPPRTQNVLHVGDACVLHGSGDFDIADLSAVRRRFPGRHVTLEGDVITVRPTPRPTP